MCRLARQRLPAGDLRQVHQSIAALPELLGHAIEGPGQLTVLPVGLSFEARKAFRGRVLVAELSEGADGFFVQSLRHVPFALLDSDVSQPEFGVGDSTRVGEREIDRQGFVGASLRRHKVACGGGEIRDADEGSAASSSRTGVGTQRALESAAPFRDVLVLWMCAPL